MASTRSLNGTDIRLPIVNSIWWRRQRNEITDNQSDIRDSRGLSKCRSMLLYRREEIRMERPNRKGTSQDAKRMGGYV